MKLSKLLGSLLLMVSVVSASPLQYYNKYTTDTLTLPVLILTFDDGFVDNYLYAIPKLDSMGFKASFYVNGGFVGGPTAYVDANLSSMTITQLKDVQSRGHDIINHGFLHVGLVGKTKTEVLNEINRNKTFLDIHRFYGNDIFALTGGAYDSTVNSYIDTVVSFSRTTNGSSGATYLNYGNDKNLEMYTDTIVWVDRILGTVAQYKAGIDSIHVRTNKQRVYILVFHSVSDLYTGGGSIGINEFDTLMRHIKNKSDSSKLQVLSLRQFFGANIALSRVSDSLVKAGQYINLKGYGFKNSGTSVTIGGNDAKIINQESGLMTIRVPNKSGTCTLSVTNNDSKNVKYTLVVSDMVSNTPLISNATSSKRFSINRNLIDTTLSHFPLFLNLNKLNGTQTFYNLSHYFADTSVAKFTESLGDGVGSCFIDASISNDTSVEFTTYIGNMSDTNSVVAFTGSNCSARFSMEQSGAPVDDCGNATDITENGTFGKDSTGAYGNSKSWRLNTGCGITGSLASLANASQFTLELWLKIYSKAGSNRLIFSINGGAGGSILLQSTGITMGFNGGYYTAPTFYDYFTLNDWHHLTFVFDGTAAVANRWKLYIDGVDRSYIMAVTANFPATLGASPIFDIGLAAFPLACQMDDVRIYSDAKTAKWVSTEYNNLTNEYVIFQFGDLISTGLKNGLWNVVKQRMRAGFK